LVPRLQGNISYEEILKILSMQEYSSNFQIRALEYRSFKSKLYEYLKKSPTTIPTLEFLQGMGEEYERVQENITSLTEILDLRGEGFSEVLDHFLRAPLLSFTEGDNNLVGFEEGNSIIKDHQGNNITQEDANKDNFSFAEDDLDNFQDLIQSIQEQKDNELVQYSGNFSLFSDFFIRSYLNACQLYFREIVFDLEVGNISSDTPTFKIATISKTEGDAVAKGDTVINILGGNSQIIPINAPFEGNIKKVWVKEND